VTAPYSSADLHVHTTYSDGASTPAEVVARAVERGLAVIAITDHDCVDGAVEAARLAPPGCEVIIGEEVTSLDGHILALFLDQTVPPGLDAATTIAEIHAQGGLAIPAHPYLRLGGARGVGARGEGLAWDAVETCNGSPGAWLANRVAWRRRSKWSRASTGGSDAHILDAVGAAVTQFPGRTAAELRAAVEAGLTLPRRLDHSPLIAARTLARSLRRRLSGESAREVARRAVRAAGR
jgi:predicted metal-dependent phosphoesterase TrpH